jgi:hypothetical protein
MINISALRAFREAFYPDIKVEIILDPGLKNKGLRGLAEGDTISLSEIISSEDISDWQSRLPGGVKINAVGALYCILLHELGHVWLGHTTRKRKAQTDTRPSVTVEEAIKELQLSEELGERVKRLIAEREEVATKFAIIEFMRLKDLGVFI